MIGLDSNVLIRYFTQDDPVQSPAATEILEQQLNSDEPGFVSLVTVTETIWVLQRSYRLTGEALAAVLEHLLQVDTLIVEGEAEVFTAFIAFRNGVGEFADALIGALSARAGCSRVLTFDRGALGLPGFALAQVRRAPN